MRDWTAPVLAKARERLIEEVDKDAISVFISVNLIEELLGISTTDPQKYLRVINLLWRVGQNNLLHSTEDLGCAEAKNGGPLEGNDRLEWWINVDIAVDVLRVSFEPALPGDLGDPHGMPPLLLKRIALRPCSEMHRGNEGAAARERRSASPVFDRIDLQAFLGRARARDLADRQENASCRNPSPRKDCLVPCVDRHLRSWQTARRRAHSAAGHQGHTTAPDMNFEPSAVCRDPWRFI